ncbi:CusA/CzcA family heavy metal efflux RND transporter [Petrimonas sp.]|uniref:CusA/CzcA family heavy metal efflux RND transporter n=1 Tax=Petrimonas sp. TaxID=2023866 RepID=UPI003F51988A
MLNKIIRFSVKHKLIIILFTITIAGFGTFALLNLSVGAVPDITNNQVQVITTSTSLATQDVEQYITMPVELAMANLPGVQEIRSVSKFGLSVVTIVFDEKLGTYLPRQLIAEKISEASENIPQGFGTPMMGPVTTGLGEIYQYILDEKPGYENRYSTTDLRTIQDWIVKRQLSGIPGVVEINTWGGFLKQYEIAVNPELIRSQGITLMEIFDAIDNNNNITGGSYIEKNNQSYFIRGDGAIKSLDDIRNIVVRNRNGIPVLIGDIAAVQFGHANRFGAITANGQGEKVMGQIMMLKNADSKKVIKAVHERVAEVQKSLPEGIFINPIVDRSELIGRTTMTVFENLLFGCIIVILVVLAILGNLRTAMIIASIIPLSLLFTLSLMYIFGIDANLMSLGALDFGIIIDGGVIVAEFIALNLNNHYADANRLHGQERKNYIDEITIKGASKMMNSAIFGQIIILIVFIPIISLTGVEGKMFRPMALTFCFAVIGASLLGMTWLPVASALFMKPKENGEKNVSKVMQLAYKTYKPSIEWACRHKKIVVIGALAMLVGALLIFNRLGAEFTPTLDEGDFVIQPVLKTGTSLKKTIEMTTQMEAILKKEFVEVDQVVSRIGAAEVPTDPMSMEEIDMIIKLRPKKEWKNAKSKEELADKFKEALSVFPGIEYEFTQPIEMRFNELVTGVRSDIAVKIFGEDLDYLAEKANEIAAQARTVPGAADVIVEKTVGLPQMRVTYNRDKLAYYGVSIASLNQYLSMAFGGQISGTVFEQERSFDLVVRFLEDFRQDIDNIRQMYVNLPDGNQVRLSELAQIEYSSGPAKISRDNTHRRVVVSVNVRNRDLQSVVQDIQQKVGDNVSLQSGYYVEYGGQYQNLRNASTRLMIIVPIALALIFLLLNFAFNSLKETIIIFSAIPLSIVGGVLLLWIRGMPFSISAGVGFIALFGVAVLNGIVLIEHFKELRHKNGGVNMHDIIVQGSVDRLRPVILTAAAAAMGFLPMAVSTSAGAEVQRPLATVVIGGLVTSTFLTMIVLPLLYGYFMDDNRWRKKARSGKRMLPKVKFWFVPMLMTISVAAVSQTRELSLDDAIAAGIANNRQLKTYELQIERSKAFVPAAFNIGKTGVYYGTDANNIAENNHPLYVIGVSQEINFPTVYTAQHKANRIGVSVSQAAYELELQKLSKHITQAYYRIVYLQNKQQHYDYIAGIYRKFSQSADAQYKQGEIAYLEKLNATAKQQQIDIQQKQAASDLQIAYRQLNLLLQSPDDISVPFQPLEPVLLNENTYNNAGLRLADEQLRYENALLGVEKNLWLPNINVEVFNGTNRYANAKNYWGWQVGVSIPLFFGEQRARVASQKYSVMMADYSKQQHQMRYISTNDQLRNELVKYRQNIDYYQTSGKQISNELIKFATSSYEVGEIDFFRYIQSLENATQLRLDYLDNLAKYNETVIALNYLMVE